MSTVLSKYRSGGWAVLDIQRTIQSESGDLHKCSRVDADRPLRPPMAHWAIRICDTIGYSAGHQLESMCIFCSTSRSTAESRY